MKNIIKYKVIEILDKSPFIKNLARKKFFVDFLAGMISTRKVQFQEIALHMDSEAKTESTERRIQAFFQGYDFDYAQACALLALFLPKGKISLSIDRTEWDFGKYQCNILMIVAKNGPSAIPLYWELLDNKSGNSSSEDRVCLLGKLISALGAKRVGLVAGDREFVGITWIKHLKTNGINFCMRVPKNHFITLKNGSVFGIPELLPNFAPRYYCGCMVDGVVCNAMIKKLPGDDYLFLIGNLPPKEMGAAYRSRWCIEVLFQSFKERGFDLESTHLKCSKKIAKLLVFVSLAVAICTKIGEYHHEKVQKIKTKNHGYRAKSFFRSGLDLLRKGLKHGGEEFVVLWQNCASLFIRWMNLQLPHSQYAQKIIG